MMMAKKWGGVFKHRSLVSQKVGGGGLKPSSLIEVYAYDWVVV